MSKATETLLRVVKKIGVTGIRQVVETQGLVFCKVLVMPNCRGAKYDKQRTEPQKLEADQIKNLWTELQKG